jgi:riboflavin biosynthesis pyrimidine reductase
VVIGAGNLRAEGNHVWTADRICPELSPAYARLRGALGKAAAPLQVVVTGSGDVDVSRAVFSGVAPAMLVTTRAGAARIAAQGSSIRVEVLGREAGWISLPSILEAARLGPGALVLVESGPTSITQFLAESAVDELFLTRAPSFVGRGGQTPALTLLEGRFFRPGTLDGRLLSVRRRGDFLFLRYATTR